MIAPSILQSSKSFCEVNRQFILKPPSKIPFSCSFGESKIIIAPRSLRIMSSITFLSEVPGDTNFRKSMKDFSFSGAIMENRRCKYLYFVWDFWDWMNF